MLGNASKLPTISEPSDPLHFGHPTSANKDQLPANRSPDEVVTEEKETSRKKSVSFKQNGDTENSQPSRRSSSFSDPMSGPVKAARRLSQIITGNLDQSPSRSEPNPFSSFDLSPGLRRASATPAPTLNATKAPEIRRSSKDKDRFDGPPKVEVGLFYREMRGMERDPSGRCDI